MAVQREAGTSTRERILGAAATLFRQRGYAATGIKSILSESDVPYGSLYHHFPGGKDELGIAALRTGGETYRLLVESIFSEERDAVAATREFFDGAAAVVEATDYADACPVATIALEVASTNEPMRVAAAAAFESWIRVLEHRLRAAGVTRQRAHDLAVEIFCAVEGAFLLSRTTKSIEPIRIAGRASARAVAGALTRVGRH